MGKYRGLIDRLRTPEWKAAADALVKADGRANAPLCRALLSHPNEDVRHDVAEILGDRGSAKAIPALIDALADDCLFVRHDALWSIERICSMEIGGLVAWLDVDFDKPGELKQKVESWWRLVRRFIQRDEFLDGVTTKREAVDQAVGIIIDACLAKVPTSKRKSKAVIWAEVQATVSRVFDKYQFA